MGRPISALQGPSHDSEATLQAPLQCESLAKDPLGCNTAIDRSLNGSCLTERIGRTEGTVKVHLKNILQKLDVGDRTEAVTTALRRGFIRLD